MLEWSDFSYTSYTYLIRISYIEKVRWSKFACNILTNNKVQPIVYMTTKRYIAPFGSFRFIYSKKFTSPKVKCFYILVTSCHTFHRVFASRARSAHTLSRSLKQLFMRLFNSCGQYCANNDMNPSYYTYLSRTKFAKGSRHSHTLPHTHTHTE